MKNQEYKNDEIKKIYEEQPKVKNESSPSSINKKKKKTTLHGEIKSRKKWDKKKKRRVILAIVIGIISILGIVFGTYIYKANGNIADAALNMAADVLGEEDPLFILVLGVSEDISIELTDTIILAGYNPDSQKAFMLSIPRDTFVGKNEAYASGYDKINALYQKSPEKTIEAVEKLTGIKIDYYVVVKNSALPAIVNAIGEVEFDVPIDMDYDDPTQNLHIHLKKGVQKINGEKAEQLLRFRHNNDGSSYPIEYGDNDYGRMRTQREFIKAVASHLISWNNVTKLKEIGNAVFSNIITDMSSAKMLGYAPHALKLNVNEIRMEQLPGSSAKINELWFYKHDSIETYDLINEFLTELQLDEQELKESYTPTKKTKNTSTVSTKKENAQNIVSNLTNEVTLDNKNTNTTVEHKHNYSSKVVKEATCKNTGIRTYTCSCGENYNEEIEKDTHKYKITESISGNIKTIKKTCTVCGDTKTTTETIKEENNEGTSNTVGNTTVPDSTTQEKPTPPVNTDPVTPETPPEVTPPETNTTDPSPSVPDSTIPENTNSVT